MTISDTGYGILPKDLPHIFERFYRADSKMLDRVSGAGLGLYISKNIVDMHGGSLTVHCVVERGTTFTLTLPRNHEVEQSHQVKKNENFFHTVFSQLLPSRR